MVPATPQRAGDVNLQGTYYRKLDIFAIYIVQFVYITDIWLDKTGTTAKLYVVCWGSRFVRDKHILVPKLGQNWEGAHTKTKVTKIETKLYSSVCIVMGNFMYKPQLLEKNRALINRILSKIWSIAQTSILFWVRGGGRGFTKSHPCVPLSVVLRCYEAFLLAGHGECRENRDRGPVYKCV